MTFDVQFTATVIVGADIYLYFLSKCKKIMACIENQFTCAKFIFKIIRLLSCLLRAIDLYHAMLKQKILHV